MFFNVSLVHAILVFIRDQPSQAICGGSCTLLALPAFELNSFLQKPVAFPEPRGEAAPNRLADTMAERMSAPWPAGPLTQPPHHPYSIASPTVRTGSPAVGQQLSRSTVGGSWPLSGSE